MDDNNTCTCTTNLHSQIVYLPWISFLCHCLIVALYFVCPHFFSSRGAHPDYAETELASLQFVKFESTTILNGNIIPYIVMCFPRYMFDHIVNSYLLGLRSSGAEWIGERNVTDVWRLWCNLLQQSIHDFLCLHPAAVLCLEVQLEDWLLKRSVIGYICPRRHDSHEEPCTELHELLFPKCFEEIVTEYQSHMNNL